jgi:hypothetical protein
MLDPLSGEILMTNQPVNTNAAQSAPQKISAKDIHTKWDKISEQEASGMKLTSDLIAQVQAKYGLSPDQAQRDVSAWAGNRSF